MNDAEKQRTLEEEQLRRSLQGQSLGVAIFLSVIVPGLSKPASRRKGRARRTDPASGGTNRN